MHENGRPWRSLGPNTFFLISQVMDMIEDLPTNNDNFEKTDLRQLKVLLNYLPGNDFNDLFRLASSFGQEDRKQAKVKFFIYGLPSDSLFPRNILHFAYSSFSVHWL
ncbi:S-adenosyl-L-methionine-dependentmethyltransferases superfamily protein [Striga asiatica]|uniref:S-adenosyl-L-methionine-dependentmethyltransferases superfamily protein n=1 Tax=Striga asiatica TaxID=4170 RepID=A0A5A7QTP9_STRAF|nr:S-adenosyl-L-methionine-dependentmethyltransferases superfamily protein [Striga asiatica]